MSNILKIYMIYKVIYHFYQKEWKLQNFNKLVCNLYDSKNYAVHKRNLKQALNHGLILKKNQRAIKFNLELV